jgi:ElaB/YqjD/DUF883 family membrane-anchored ribosome-binding protein
MTNETSSRVSGVRQRTHDSVDRMMDKAESMRDSSEDAIARLKEKVITLKENVDDHIKENPERSVLIAAGIGVVIGAALTAVVMRRR